MKRLLMTLTMSVFLLNLCLGQIPKEAFPLTNSLYDLWYNGETEKAIETSLELYRLYPPMFINRIHNTLAQLLQYDSKLYGQKYLEQLLLKKNDEINNIISPIYLWSKSINAKTENELKEILKELNGILRDSANYKSESERYCLLILQELDKKNTLDAITKEKILQKNINNLEAYPSINKVIAGNSEGEKRAWHRYLLAYSYNYLYSVKPNVAEYLKKASNYSPDLNDRQYKHAYFYDAALLTGNTREFGFQTKYLKYLMENNHNADALDLLSDITFGNPSDYNITTLREFYEKLQSSNSFTDYWTNYIHEKGKPVPKLKIQFEKEQLDLTKEPGKWVYIDVWGTWCSPCREELPELQSLFVENNKSSNAKLKVYTFSYSSQNLSKFMTENKYTFPVSEIDQQTNDLFEVSEYPTKILISPQGNFIKIPFGVDWKLYIKNYTMM